MKKEIEKKAYEFAAEIYEQGYSDGKGQLKSESEMYEKGLKDAWECARKIACPVGICEGMSPIKLNKIFGSAITSVILEKNSVFEAIDKIKEYEEEQTDDEIKVGDEVTDGDDTGVCTKISYENNCLYVMWHDGSIGDWYRNIDKFKKTGRHFPQIVEVLEQVRGDADGNES